MRFYKLTDRAYKYYKNKVKNNEDVSFELAEKKLNRNIKLGLPIEPDKYMHKQLYVYGRLLILVVFDEITWIQNHRTMPDGWSVDMKRYHKLNKLLGIPSEGGVYESNKSRQEKVC